jgi:hypothetical protein
MVTSGLRNGSLTSPNIGDCCPELPFEYVPVAFEPLWTKPKDLRTLSSDSVRCVSGLDRRSPIDRVWLCRGIHLFRLLLRFVDADIRLSISRSLARALPITGASSLGSSFPKLRLRVRCLTYLAHSFLSTSLFFPSATTRLANAENTSLSPSLSSGLPGGVM